MSNSCVKIAVGLLFLMIMTGCETYADDDIICEEAYRDLCGEYAANEDAPGMANCLKINFDQLPAICQPLTRSHLQQFEAMKAPCRDDLKAFCNYDIDQAFPDTKEEADELFGCFLENWQQLNFECQDYLRRSVPFFPVIEEGLGPEGISGYKKREAGQKVTVKGFNGTVTATEQQGDVIWYKAKLIDREVVESYPFCPEVEDEGLKLRTSPYGHTCDYEIIDTMRNDIISELKEKQLLELINYLGVRDEWKVMSNMEIVNILDKYSSRCPEGFVIDLNNHQETGNIEVFCASVERQECDFFKGWVKSYPKEGMYGCKKMAKCVDMDGGYEDFGHKKLCGYCYAGGCVDSSRTHNYHTNPLVYCKVNTADPELTRCEE